MMERRPTAACENSFSCMNRQKTNIQTNLSLDTLDGIMGMILIHTVTCRKLAKM